MRKGTCKHYNGNWHNTHCLAGVCYKDVTTGTDKEPGSAFRKPCVDWDVTGWGCEPMTDSQRVEWERRGTCDKREEPSDEEIKAFDERMDLHFKKVELVTKFLLPLRREHKGKGYVGVLECPACKGILHVNIASINGHARVMCETEDCVRWME